MSKKIAFVTPAYVDEFFRSGGVKLNYMLLEGLKEKGFSIDLYTDDLISSKKNIFFQVYPLKELEQNRALYSIILSNKAYVKSDITYIHDHSYNFRVEKMSNKFSHFFYKIFNRKRHIERLKEFSETKNNICNTKKVIVSSQVLKEDMINNYGVSPDRIEILPPPVEKSNKIQRSKNEVFTFGISTVGFERKGGYLVLSAKKRLAKKNKNFKVVFIYPSKNFYINLKIFLYGIKKYCQFIPAQTDMNKFYSSIDCLLMPSLLEPFGMVATEALAVGTPVITAKHCGASDFIKDGVNGFVYDYSSRKIDELVLAMEKMLDISNPDEIFRDNCLKSVENICFERFLDKYLLYINEIITAKTD